MTRHNVSQFYIKHIISDINDVVFEKTYETKKKKQVSDLLGYKNTTCLYYEVL